MASARSYGNYPAITRHNTLCELSEGTLNKIGVRAALYPRADGTDAAEIELTVLADSDLTKDYTSYDTVVLHVHGGGFVCMRYAY